MTWIQRQTESCRKWGSSLWDRLQSMYTQTTKGLVTSTNSIWRELRNTMIGEWQVNRTTTSQESNLLTIMLPTQWMTRCTETLKSCAKVTMILAYSPTIRKIYTHRNKNQSQRRGQTPRHKRDTRRLQPVVQSQFQPQHTNKDPKQQILCSKGQPCTRSRGKKTNTFKAWRKIRNKLWPTCLRKCRVCRSWPPQHPKGHPKQLRNSNTQEPMCWPSSLRQVLVPTNISISRHILKICQTWRDRCKIKRPNASNWARGLIYSKKKLLRECEKYRSIQKGWIRS